MAWEPLGCASHSYLYLLTEESVTDKQTNTHNQLLILILFLEFYLYQNTVWNTRMFIVQILKEIINFECRPYRISCRHRLLRFFSWVFSGRGLTNRFRDETWISFFAFDVTIATNSYFLPLFLRVDELFSKHLINSIIDFWWQQAILDILCSLIN